MMKISPCCLQQLFSQVVAELLQRHPVKWDFETISQSQMRQTTRGLIFISYFYPPISVNMLSNIIIVKHDISTPCCEPLCCTRRPGTRQTHWYRLEWPLLPPPPTLQPFNKWWEMVKMGVKSGWFMSQKWSNLLPLNKVVVPLQNCDCSLFLSPVTIRLRFYEECLL